MTDITVVYPCTKKLIYLFIKGKVPSLLRLWFAAGVVRFAGSENMILNMVHVVETFVLKEKIITHNTCKTQLLQNTNNYNKYVLNK